MGTAPPAKQASIVNDPTVEKDGLGHQCYTFSSPDEQRIVVAFWEARPWEANAIASNVVITLPADHEPRHILLYDLLSGNQTEIPWKGSEDNRISIKVSISGAPKLVIARS